MLRKAMTALEHWLALQLVGRPTDQPFPQDLSSVKGLLDSDYKNELLKLLSNEECTLLINAKSRGNKVAHPPVRKDEIQQLLDWLPTSDRPMGERLLQLLGQFCTENGKQFAHDPLRFNPSTTPPGLYLDC